MRDDYPAFRKAGVQIVVVTRHDATYMRDFWRKHRLPYLGIPDPDGRITSRYRQQWHLFRLGRMPAQFLVDCRGKLAYVHYGKSMSDTPTNAEMLARAGRLPGCAAPGPAATSPPPKKGPPSK